MPEFSGACGGVCRSFCEFRGGLLELLLAHGGGMPELLEAQGGVCRKFWRRKGGYAGAFVG